MPMAQSTHRWSRGGARFLLVIVALGLIEWRIRATRLKPSATSSATAPMIGEYFIGGAVPRPGAYTVTGRTITLRQALLAAAFGPREAKEAAFISINRRTANDGEELIKVEPAALFDRGEGNEPLQPNDQVFVVEKSTPLGAP